jgi:hypothetical protein
MDTRTLASRFEEAAHALRAGAAADALQALDGLDGSTMTSAAASLLAQLRRRGLSDAQRDVPQDEQGTVRLLQLDASTPRPGVSLVSACMNRQGNLLKVLPSWLASSADEIIIVDWSSTEPVAPMLAHISDSRLKIVRIEDEPRWILTHAFNVGLRLASHEVVFKLDADIRMEADFLTRNQVRAGTFVRGFWKSAVDAGEADQKYINGSFGARKLDLRTAGYYDERILTYGWDDSDLYHRLSHAHGLAGHLLAHDSLHHLPQEDAQRLENQAVRSDLFLGCFAPTEHQNLVNKFDTMLRGDWGSWHPPQDYALRSDGRAGWVGRRATALVGHTASVRHVAEVLAANQLARDSASRFPHIPWETVTSFEFARLLSDARAQGMDDRLTRALSTRQGVHILRCPQPALRNAVRHTIATVHEHLPSLAENIFITEDDGFRADAAPSSVKGELRASAGLLESLARSLGAVPCPDIAQLESRLLADAATCTSWTIDFEGLAASAIAKADHVATGLGAHFHQCAQPAPATAVVTSVYDERNLLRLVEYLACVVLNLRAVERMLLCYEVRDGSFQMVVDRICATSKIPPQRLALLPLAGRPTFETLFGLQSLLPLGTRLAVCNADVVLDGTFHKLSEGADANVVYAISRWDIGSDGHSVEPIRLENGTPNTFSADVWVATTPFQPDFYLDYPIGTIHCDSFINNQLSRSKRYRVINPCLDVHVFHLHDSRFNSSAEKQVRMKEEIERRWEAERIRNDGLTPVKGAPWTYLTHGALTSDPSFLLEWRPRALVLDVPQFTVAGLLWVHLASRLLGKGEYLTVVVRLTPEDGAGAVGRLLARYKHFTGISTLQFDVAGAPLRPDAPAAAHAETRSAEASEFVAALGTDGLGALAQKLDVLTRFPSDPTVYQVRADLHIETDTAAHLDLIEAVRKSAPHLLGELKTFLVALDAWSEESLLMRPFETDLFQAANRAPSLHLEKPDVTFVTSLFRGDEFLPGYLENVAHAAVASNGEVVLVDANCDGHDSVAIEDFFRRHPEFRKLFTILTMDRDPGLYACWQIGIERARSEFISNANLDDRRSPSHTPRLVNLLRARADVAGACGSMSAVTKSSQGSWFEVAPNQVWFKDLGAHDFGFEDLFAYNADRTVRSHNIMHCMPVWRRDLHARFGFFDEDKYGTSADWAFWLACAKAGERFHLDIQAFGRYFLNPSSHNRRNDANGLKERRIIADLIGVVQEGIIKQ